MKIKRRASQYGKLLQDIRSRVLAAQHQALRAVNRELISLYWDIGRMITERQRGATWGKAIVQKLSEDLQREFPGIKGFSSQNLWRMKQFYLVYTPDPKLSQLVREIGWSQNLTIFMGCKDRLEREFYLRMTRRMGWSKNVLIHKIEQRTYEKMLLCKRILTKRFLPRSGIKPRLP